MNGKKAQIKGGKLFEVLTIADTDSAFGVEDCLIIVIVNTEKSNTFMKGKSLTFCEMCLFAFMLGV